MDVSYKPYLNPEVASLIERLHPPRVCIDNQACRDSTLVKVDSANKHGILLEMVQILTDLDLVISKSYISSDGGWLMDVFHVTDQMGNKITDETLLHYIQEAITKNRRENTMNGQPYIRPRHVLTELTALEMTGTDRPGLISEISAVLAELGCHVSAAVAWTHKTRAACIIYVEDLPKGGPITDPCRVAHVQAHLENVIEAHHYDGERRSVRLTAPASSQTHTERRLHQLMAADKDYEGCCSCCDGDACRMFHWKGCDGTHVKVDNCKEKGYYLVTVQSRDRPKLLFDTICALTDMQYVVFHAAISSKGFIASQEYYVRHKGECTLHSETERLKFMSQCLIAAIERRVSHGLRLDVTTENRIGLLSDVTRVFRENGWSINRAEIGTSGEKAVGTFYVKDASGENIDPKTIEIVRKEIGASVVLVEKAMEWPYSQGTSTNTSRSNSGGFEDKSRFSIGGLLWSQLAKISNNFKPVR